MIFCKKSISDLLAGRKEQTRRLVKEGENFIPNSTGKLRGDFVKGDEVYSIKSLKTKWQVGKDYSVQPGRAKPCLWYCPKCKSSGKPHEFISENKLIIKSMAGGFCFHEIKPLRVKITGIKKERLLNISEEDAKREGYRSKAEFLHSFCLINNYSPKLLVNNNIFVWVLSMEVV